MDKPTGTHSTHTKRSLEFKRYNDRLLNRLAVLIDGCERAENQRELGDLLRRIQETLTYNTTDSGCVVDAGENELIFTLREKDKLFIPTLAYWIDKAEELGLHADKLDAAKECYMAAVANVADRANKHA